MTGGPQIYFEAFIFTYLNIKALRPLRALNKNAFRNLLVDRREHFLFVAIVIFDDQLALFGFL